MERVTERREVQLQVQATRGKRHFRTFNWYLRSPQYQVPSPQTNAQNELPQEVANDKPDSATTAKLKSIEHH